MKNLLIILFVALFTLHFTAEVFITDKKLQKQINDGAFYGMALFFIISILTAIFIGI